MVAGGAVLAVAKLLQSRVRLKGNTRTVYYVNVYVIAGALRSLITYQLVSVSSEVNLVSADLVRVSILGAMHGLVWLSLFAILLDIADGYRKNRSRHIELQRQLIEYSQKAESSLAQDVEQVRLMIRSRLQPVLNRVTYQIQQSSPAGSDILKAAEELRKTCDTEVRNLSHRLSEPVIESELKSDFDESISWRKLFSERVFRAELHLVPIYVFMYYLGAFFVIAQGHPELLIHNLIVVLGAFVISWIISKLFWQKYEWEYRLLQVFVVHLVSIAAIWFFLVQDFGYQEFPKLRTQAIIDVPISFISLWVFFSFLESFRAFGEEVSLEANKIEETLLREQLNHRIQRTKLRRLLSKLLHGNIQGGLAAVSLALVSSQAGNPPNRDQLVQQAEAKLRKVQVELNDILTLELSDENFSNSNYELSLSLIQSEITQWQGLLDIKLHFADQALSMASALGLGDAVLTAVRESLQNSVRHGHARNVEISLEIYSKEIVLLIQDDGGYELREPLIEGQGGREIAAAGGTRNLTRADGLTTVRVSWDISALD